MCGISGFVDFAKKSNKSILEKMNRTMVHRGPDGEGYGIFPTNEAIIGLGHRRLSIIDLTEGGAQPKVFQNLHITFNGEIYNHEEIRKTLELKGHYFETHSDTEVILHAYKEWGSAALNKFVGMFAFVIYDSLNKKIFACRDRAGVKPFFYYFHEGLFLFASELKAILQHPTFKKEINLNSVASFMQYGYVPTPNCIFSYTYKLKPGHFLELDIYKNKLITNQYWSVYQAYNKPILKIDLPEAIAETERVLIKAFNYRMVSDVPVGVFLSGGYDSSCVTALLQKDKTEKIKTFTIGMPDAGLNEAPFAKEIALQLDTDHTEYYCTQKEALEIVPTLPFFYDEPFADSSAIPTILVSRIAKEKVTVALSADAGDEIFAGYNRYDYFEGFGNKLQKTPAFARKTFAKLMNAVSPKSIPILNKKHLFADRYEKLKKLLNSPTEQNLLLSMVGNFTDFEINSLFKVNTKKQNTAFDSKELNIENFSMLNYMMAMDYETYLLDDILQKVDRAGMSVSLEGREPFLDQNIIEWVAQLPTNYKYNNGSKKFVLKQIVHKYLPKQLMDRPKMGFGIPIASWLQSDLKQYVDKFFDKAYVVKQGIFDFSIIERIKNDFYINKTERAEKIWYILMFQMWYDKWIENN
jgi:asparagine synthase (glutamine-hydrolysing)